MSMFRFSKPITTIIFCSLLAREASGQTANQLSRTTTSTIRSSQDKYGNPVITTINRRYNFTEVLPTHNLGSPQNSWMVLLEEFRSEWSPGIEGKRATVQIDGWAGQFPNPRKKLWTIRSEGDERQTHDNFYKATRYGCCANLNTQVWFSLIDGQKVFTSTTDPVRVIVPNSKADLTRYFAWHSSGASLPPSELKTMTSLRRRFRSKMTSFKSVKPESAMESFWKPQNRLPTESLATVF